MKVREEQAKKPEATSYFNMVCGYVYRCGNEYWMYVSGTQTSIWINLTKSKAFTSLEMSRNESSAFVKVEAELVIL